NDHALAQIGELYAALDQAFAEKLRFVYADHLRARRDFRENVFAGGHQLRIQLQAGVRDDTVLGVALVDYRLENLNALFRNFRASQAANEFLTLAGKHWPDDDFDPAHVALDDIHASPFWLQAST